jgi:hypothetical protein
LGVVVGGPTVVGATGGVLVVVLGAGFAVVVVTGRVVVVVVGGLVVVVVVVGGLVDVVVVDGLGTEVVVVVAAPVAGAPLMVRTGLHTVPATVAAIMLRYPILIGTPSVFRITPRADDRTRRRGAPRGRRRHGGAGEQLSAVR